MSKEHHAHEPEPASGDTHHHNGQASENSPLPSSAEHGNHVSHDRDGVTSHVVAGADSVQHDTHHGHGASHDRAHGARGEHSEHGDALAAPVSHAGHAGHVGHVAKFRRLFWIMLVLAVPAVGFNEMFAHVIGYHLTEAGWVPWVSTVLGAVIYFWGGWPFLTGAVSEIRSRKPGMMLLIGLAITVAFVDSWEASTGLLSHELNFWWELALLVVIMLVGHWIEMRSLVQTTSALDSLAVLLPDEAEKVVGDEIVKVAPADLVVGDVVIVRPGASVPADGRIVDGGRVDGRGDDHGRVQAGAPRDRGHGRRGHDRDLTFSPEVRVHTVGGRRRREPSADCKGTSCRNENMNPITVDFLE